MSFKGNPIEAVCQSNKIAALLSSSNKIFEIKTETDFNSCALEVFNFQYENTPIYRSYGNHNNNHLDKIKHLKFNKPKKF